jgi:hypothetical protein
MVRALPERPEHKRWQVVAAWSLVPLIAWSGRPLAGCICADGHYEAACRSGLRHAVNHGAEPCSSGMTHGSPSCCAASRGHSACGEQETDCCRNARQSRRVECEFPGNVVGNNGCCTPVVQPSSLLSVVRGAQIACDHQFQALSVATLDVPCLASSWTSFRRVETDIGPPPIDLVVTLRHLII